MPRSRSALGRLRRRVRRRWKHRSGIVPWLTARPQLALVRVLSWLPDAHALAAADRLGRLTLLSSRRRRLGAVHLAQAFPERGEAERRALLRASCGHLGRSAAEAAVLMSGMTHEKFRGLIEYEAGALELLEAHRGRGVLLLQSHLGSIEFTTGALAVNELRPMTVMRLPRNHYLAAALLESRNRGGVSAIPRKGALKHMLMGLKDGRAVVLTFDQNAPGAPLFVPWFGRLAATERAPAALALKTGAPVLVCWCVRQEGSRPYRLGCRLLREAAPPAAATDVAMHAFTCKAHAALEDVVRRFPEQYLWIHDRYRTRPAEEQA